MDGTRWNRMEQGKECWPRIGTGLCVINFNSPSCPYTLEPQNLPLSYSLRISFPFSLSLTGPTNCNRAPASGGNRLMWHGLWSPGSNNAQNTRALLHAGLAHTKLHVNFSINLAHTFKMHLDALFLLKYIQVTDCIYCSG